MSTLSFSVSLADCRERKYKPPAMSAMRMTAAAAISGIRDFFSGGTGMAGAETALMAEPVATVCDEDAGDTFVRDDAVCAGSGIVGRAPELVATARPLSVSRLRRCRSARMSAAC